MQVLLVGIANAIDLTERSLPALKLRGSAPALLTFSPYTAAEVAAILKATAARMEDSVFQQPALDLCARSVSSTSGDMRAALRACRLALDNALARTQQQQQKHQQRQLQAGEEEENVGVPGGVNGAAAAAPVAVTMRDMAAALAKLAGARSAQASAVHAASIRSLPLQQQLLLFALSLLCTPQQGGEEEEEEERDGGAGAGGFAAALSPAARLLTGPAWATPPSKMSASAGWGASSAGKRKAGGGKTGAAFASAVAIEDLHAQLTRVCKLVGMAVAPQQELRHMLDLLAQMALVDVRSAGGGGTPSGGGGGGLRGLGGRRNGFGSAKGRGRGAAAAPAPGRVMVALRANHAEVNCAMAANPALRALLTE